MSAPKRGAPWSEDELDPNPYAPPRAIEAPPRRPRRTSAATGVPSRWFWAFVALNAVAVVLDGLMIGGIIAWNPAGLLRLIGMGVGLGWMGAQWNRLPERLRQVRGTSISAGGAVGRLFIPIWGIYWLFAVHLGLCDAITIRLIERDRPLVAPRGLALMACLTHLLSGALAFAGNLGVVGGAIVRTVIWAVYMWKLEQAFVVALGRRRRP